ncbi:MAG: ABC transporter permease [Lachnospiraceae bacterium]|nr:ABC transporter permease [Lachnospiraceae bacterium]
MTYRSICAFFGRYLALLFIVALSAGFFAGLKVTRDAMNHTGDLFLTEQNFYDFRLFSTLGFTEDDMETFAKISCVETAEATKTVDAMLYYDGNTHPFTLYAMPEHINLPALTEGRMPEAENECLADDERFSAKDIGKKISLSEENTESVREGLTNKEYTIVGLVDSPMYIGIDRGSTGIGNGVVYSYLYLPEENFTGEIYTEIDVVLKEKAPLYSDAYDVLIEENKQQMMDACEDVATNRYEALLSEYGLTPEMGAGLGINEPDTYVLTRSENVGYVNFENDTAIVSGIANIFPIFFIMIAMVVCMTTMTRMVDEERTQIGVLKSLGYSNRAIMAKYLLYAGSATVLGWGIGFFICTWGIPKVFWFAYNALYDFSPLKYLFRPQLAVITLLVSLVGILGSTWLSCKRELYSVPAKLIRPRAAKNGKRVLLERITPLWKHLTFLQKITIRNMFRYKKRLIMMIFGVSCCAGLVVTAFGAGNSMTGIGALQYEEVQSYQMEAAFTPGAEASVAKVLAETEEVKSSIPASYQRVEVFGKEMVSGVTMMSYEDTTNLSAFWNLRSKEAPVAYPKKGEAVLNTKLAKLLDVTVGDTVEIRTADMENGTVTVSGIFDNYIYNFVMLTPETYEMYFGEWNSNTFLLNVDGELDEVAEKLTGADEITSVAQLRTTRNMVDSALACLDYIILMVVLFSGALAFVVIYNLTNINLAERSREIATVEVLGFYPKETESYVLRENLVLSVIASFIGLPLGVLFHRAVMNLILIDLLDFPYVIKPESYVYSVLCTILFACVVNLFMKRQIAKIPMAESLKAVE